MVPICAIITDIIEDRADVGQCDRAGALRVDEDSIEEFSAALKSVNVTAPRVMISKP